jgi:predicted enzyme related to lactoylglutathione lyase
MRIQYLEIVTEAVDDVCATYQELQGVTFSEPDASLGGARTAALGDGGKIGVRAPMHEAEQPVVRPYLLVDDIHKAVEAATKAGAQLAHPPLEIPGHGTFAIYFMGGNQHGLWQVEIQQS